MSESTSGAFVKEESHRSSHAGAKDSVLALNVRLFGSLSLFWKVFPLSLIAILVSSAAPSAFRWYSGKFSEGAGAMLLPYEIPILGNRIPFTLDGMVVVTGLAILFRIAAWALFETSGMWASQRIHARMVEAISRTRTTFFDENPSGRLINRLVRDFDEVRSTAIIFVGDFLNAMVEILSITFVAFLASPWAALLLLPMLSSFAYIQWQRSGMLDHARGWSAIATSHVISRENDLIEGREIFLLYGRGERLLERLGQSFRQFVDSSVLTSDIERWASFWIRMGAEAFAFGVLILLAFALSRGEVSTALAGVIISSLFGITGSMGWLDFATGLISRSAPHVRRVFEFVDLPAEAQEERARAPGPAESAESRTSAGELVFERYTMSYRKDTPVILNALDLRIPLGQKTAFIGRTGSGKTSLFQALLRMVYVQGGDIKLGGRSIFELELGELRRRFGVVPQFPYLFAGTLRSNLDRVGDLPTERLERAIETVGLRYTLDHPVAEGGQNLSLGERQLVCLARVIAAEREIILMDEPTSGLDPETDFRVNRVLRTALEGKTVLTIAHRLESLGSYDRIVEMKAGQVVWQGTPRDKLKLD